MSLYLKNTTVDPVSIQGREHAPDTWVEVPEHQLPDVSTVVGLDALIDSGDVLVSLSGVDPLSSATSQKQALRQTHFMCSIAVDMGNTDQVITDEDWVELNDSNIIWDTGGHYDQGNHNLDTPIDGLYFFDIQCRVQAFTNVSAVELAIFKRGTPDDYWFVLDHKEVLSQDFIQLKAGTKLDMYIGDQFTVKIRCLKVDSGASISMTVNGSDDYTAWGYSFESLL